MKRDKRKIKMKKEGEINEDRKESRLFASD